ncbi:MULTISPECIES: hypothetical protein [Actinosynnema]|uniref:hypothetical protein n=1 Tax=Actinosynnema TaxID=40566 RepID=UPI0020A324BC|nr:hypothetical protein [Actinosynnema pretiosum]MCP2095379.1 hypothetical protein [Actinosynnema pretiosum]
MTTWLGVNAGHEDPASAESAALALHGSLLYEAAVVCVHDVGPHWALSFRLPKAPSGNVVSTLVERGSGIALHEGGVERLAGPSELVAGALRAALAHRDRVEGVALRFPGQRALHGRYGVADVLAFSAIDEVRPHDVRSIEARGDLRPRFSGGRLVLDCS